MGRKLLYDEDNINNAAIAIQKKAGTKDTFTTADFADMIMKCGEPPSKDVDFYDYDGTRLFSYTSEEFMELTEMPALPDHTDIGLTNEGWNWSLNEVKELTDPHLNVGCTYYTTDGKTKIFYDIFKPCTQKIRCFSSVNGGAILDWGDGSEPVTITNSTAVYTHDYDTVGKYEVTLEPVDNAIVYIGGNNAAALGNCENYNPEPLKTMITGIFCGKNLFFKQQSLRCLVNVKFITFNSRMSNASFESQIMEGTNDGYAMRLGALIFPNNFKINGWHDFQRVVSKYVIPGSNLITTGVIEALFESFIPDRFIYSVSPVGGLRGSVFFDQGISGSALKRIDLYGASPGMITTKVVGMNCFNGRMSALTDVYFQKTPALPFYGDSDNNPNVLIHVPYNMYDKIMATQWGTVYGNRIIQSPKKAWEDSYDILTDPSDFIADSYIDKNTGAIATYNGWMATDFIPVNPGETLYVCFDGSSDYCCFYDAEKNRIDGDARLNYRTWNAEHRGYPFAVPSTAHYVRLSHSNAYMPYVTLWRELTN